MTYRQTEPGVADRFINDVRQLTEEIMKDPGLPSAGAVSMHCLFPLYLCIHCTYLNAYYVFRLPFTDRHKPFLIAHLLVI